jgi:hypothetical protein
VDKAWESYAKGVWNGTIERRETDDNDWEAYFAAKEEERPSIFACSRDEIVSSREGLDLLAELATL